MSDQRYDDLMGRFMQHDDRAVLSMALGHHEQIHSVGIVIYPMHRQEYINRAEGRA